MKTFASGGTHDFKITSPLLELQRLWTRQKYVKLHQSKRVVIIVSSNPSKGNF